MPNLGTILTLLRQKHEIDSLNDMQRAMSRAASPLTLLLAPTGSGKTVAFAIPLLTSLGAPGHGIQALVLAPSRELVLQIHGVLRPLAPGYKTLALYGGHPFASEQASLSVTPDIVVATPGRLLDHLNRGTATLDTVRTVVFDEYDKMLELGFEDEMRRISRRIQAPSRLIMTSATRLNTLPSWLPAKGDPAVIDFTLQQGVPDSNPSVVWVQSPSRDKLDTLVDLLKATSGDTAIIFVNHRESADRVYSRLLAERIPAGLYHGGLDQQQRENALEMLANGTTPVLVSTDLGSRGLDIDAVASVIHYHMPPTGQSWTHRNGRTARQGKPGTVYVIAAPRGEENIPEYVTADRDWVPPHTDLPAVFPCRATLYFNLGRKDKISRGDIAGFLIAKGGVAADEIGRIALRDHSALAAVPAAKAGAIIAAVGPERLKGKRVRVSRL